jgi:hypothetical protein
VIWGKEAGCNPEFSYTEDSGFLFAPNVLLQVLFFADARKRLIGNPVKGCEDIAPSFRSSAAAVSG